MHPMVSKLKWVESLMAIVSRTLRDEYKRSMNLTLYLLYIFYAYSNYSVFHEFIGQKEVGSTTMKVVDYELKRYNAKVKEFRKIKDEASVLSREEATKVVQTERNKIAKMLKKQERVLFGRIF